MIPFMRGELRAKKMKKESLFSNIKMLHHLSVETCSLATSNRIFGDQSQIKESKLLVFIVSSAI